MTDRTDVLEHNVQTLLETGGARPQISGAARARIRAELIAGHGVVAAPARWRFAIAAVVAVAAAALIVGRLALDSSAPRPGGDVRVIQVAGAEVVSAPGATVTELGPRHLRVEGEAVIDVEPGKGAFVVDTAQGWIEVRGTKLLVDAEPGRTTVAVMRGEVVLATARGRVVLHAGEQGVAEHGRPPVRGPAPRLSHLASWARHARAHDEREVPAPRHGTLFARDPRVGTATPGPAYPLPIARLAIDVVVEDQVARVALDQTFRNAADRTLEGMYRFAIPPDAALQRLAMYVDGKLTESAVVERMQGRRIYEELVVRRVDPALLEWAGTGRLSLRVYPIPPRQDKRLMLAYTQSLPRLYDDWTLAVPLPEVDQPVGAFDVAVRVKGCASCEVTSTSHRVDVARQGDDAIVSYHHAGEQIGDSLVIHVRDPRKRTTIAWSNSGADRYVMVRAPIELAEAPAYRPRTWVILDDVSASRSPLELRAQADVIDAFLRELDERDRVSVIAFDVEARTRLALTRVADVDRRAVRAALEPEGGVGATDLGVALDAALSQLAGTERDAAMIVYLGDGVITGGARNLDTLRGKLAGKAQFVGVGIGDGPDTQTLHALASATGGYATTIDLADDLAWRAFDLVAALHTSRVTGLEARLVKAGAQVVLSTTYLASPQLAEGEQLDLVAKLTGRDAPTAVELTGTLNGRPWRQTIALDATPSAAAGYLPRLWAQRRIAARLLAKHDPVAVPPCPAPASSAQMCPSEAALREQRDEMIRREVIDLGKQYFLLSRHTSLLVLENDEMYRRYGVTKGTGDTWAPYAMPSTIPIAATVASLPSPSPSTGMVQDGELVRTATPVHYDWGSLRVSWGAHRDEPGVLPVAALGDLGALASRSAGRGGLSIASDRAGAEIFDPATRANDSADRPAFDSGSPRSSSDAAPPVHAPRSSSHPIMSLLPSSGEPEDPPPRPVRYRYPGSHELAPNSAGFDDVTALVPALFRDAADGWRDLLVAGDDAHAIDDAAQSLLAEARRRLPTGVYRWGDVEIAIDDTRRIGWRRTLGTGLVETGSLDGATWTRRYAELGLDVVRAVGDDDIAVALAYAPMWIAEPSHYARWFDVAARGDREIVLSRKVRGKARPVLAMQFDDRARLIAITGAEGKRLVELTWDTGPATARVQGDEIVVGFTGQALSDAAQWAHRAAPPGVAVELPTHEVTYWHRKVAAAAEGSPAWRHAVRQLMVALAATSDHAGLWHAYEQLRAHGGVELGDLALASRGVVSSQLDKDPAPVASLAHHPLARYLIASRRYTMLGRPELLAPESREGAIGALWSLRALAVDMAAERPRSAAAALAAIGGHAPELRVIGAAAYGAQYSIPGYDEVRSCEAATIGRYRNIGRHCTADALFRHGQLDEGASRMASMFANLDLQALPPWPGPFRNWFVMSRHGEARWPLVWKTWRDRVLAGSSYAHVMALLSEWTPASGDVTPILRRAAELAGTDPARRLEVANAAIARGQSVWGEALIRAQVTAWPSRALYRILADIELRQDRLDEALRDLEAARNAGADDEVAIATVRTELAELVDVARRLAVQSAGDARARAVERALLWGARWRAVDPGNTAIDQRLGEMMLQLGDSKAAWRQMSSMIERDPWSGSGYATIADALERLGKHEDALMFWQQAIAIDQTDPTPRLRKAQALIALGRNAEADALLAEITSQNWHNAWSRVVVQARSLLQRGR